MVKPVAPGCRPDREPIVTPTTLAPDFMQTADLNSDGKLDLVIVDNSSNMVPVLLGNGDGTFQAPVSYPLGGTNPQDLALADVNGDTQPDIVVRDYDSQTVNVLLNDGTGKSAPATGSPFSVGMQVLGLEVADFNGDRKLDIARFTSRHSPFGNPAGNIIDAASSRGLRQRNELVQTRDPEIGSTQFTLP